MVNEVEVRKGCQEPFITVRKGCQEPFITDWSAEWPPRNRTTVPDTFSFILTPFPSSIRFAATVGVVSKPRAGSAIRIEPGCGSLRRAYVDVLRDAADVRFRLAKCSDAVFHSAAILLFVHDPSHAGKY